MVSCRRGQFSAKWLVVGLKLFQKWTPHVYYSRTLTQVQNDCVVKKFVPKTTFFVVRHLMTTFNDKQRGIRDQ